MKDRIFVLGILAVSLAAGFSEAAGVETSKKAEANDPAAKCFSADTVKIWEEAYCLSKTGAADPESEAFQPCAKELKADKRIPQKKCARVIWLKQRACADNPGVGRTRRECLTGKNYLKNVDSDPYVGP